MGAGAEEMGGICPQKDENHFSLKEMAQENDQDEVLDVPSGIQKGHDPHFSI